MGLWQKIFARRPASVPERTAARDQGSGPLPAPANAPPFPYPVIRCTGAEALARLQSLATGQSGRC